MAKINKSRLYLMVLSLLLIVGVLFFLEQERKSWACRNNLAALESTIVDYRHDHNGSYPLDLIASASWVSPSVSRPTNLVEALLNCPGVHPNRDLSGGKSDYTYVNWEKLMGTNPVPDQYPLIYDSHLANHLGFGINVVPVRGKCFWDFRSHWLKQFAAKHPEYHLSVPN